LWINNFDTLAAPEIRQYLKVICGLVEIDVTFTGLATDVTRVGGCEFGAEQEPQDDHKGQHELVEHRAFLFSNQFEGGVAQQQLGP
jgi:hypothetical protein